MNKTHKTFHKILLKTTARLSSLNSLNSLNSLSLLGLLSLLIPLPSTSHAYQISLGQMTASNIRSVLETTNGRDDYAFDGDMSTSFIPAIPWDKQMIQWDVNPCAWAQHPPTISIVCG